MLTNLIIAAQLKFGTVQAILLIDSQPHGDFYMLVCKRSNSPTPYPHMTITGKVNKEPGFEGQASFFSGHYDLTAEQAAGAIRNMQPSL